MDLTQRLRKLDAHSTVSNEFRVRTGHGAVLSSITVIVIIYLIRAELQYNLKKETISRVHVNATSPVGLQVHFDVTFPSIPCALLSIDASDPTGQPQSLHIDKTHRIYKHRLDANGDRIGRRSRFELGNTLLEEEHLIELMGDRLQDMEADKQSEDANNEDEDDEVADEELCGSCFGAADEDECCNTCDDVKRAYQRKGWQLDDLSLIKQCSHTKSFKDEQGEGCNISGNIALGTGGGNLHIVPGRSLENFGHEKELSLSDFLTATFETYNVTHTIHRLRFGNQFAGQTNQLDGQTRTIEDAYGMYQYYIQVVPSSFKRIFDTFTTAYGRQAQKDNFQFAVTEHLRHVTPGSKRGLPGVYFFYEVSPLHVEMEEVRRGWIQFFTSVCAVVGGFFTFMSMMDKIIYDATRPKGNQLG